MSSAEFKAILESHSLPALKKFVRESNLTVTSLKRGELIALMIKHRSRFGHIKPDEARYKRGKEKPVKVEGRGRGRPRKTPLKTPSTTTKRPTLKKAVATRATNKAIFPSKRPSAPLRTPRTPALKTPRARNPLKDVQFRSMY